ncbi:hypothetical protein PFLUV_G00170200 [Perca fluviatilis]|uniref:Uncharacterized protein n=1 Tax=Perca fluviatilis TaxID=8168 RepID=A0A6A5DZR4_PERFL|nr:hypothetical protein PFLUV_G00170200 [Perca fluviatilis]
MEVDNNNETPTNGNRSKAQILRGLLAEKLSAAGQDICAAVETTCAGYEEETAALKEENERQRKRLTVLLQPHVKLETVGLEELVVCEPAGAGRGRRRRRVKRARGPPDDEEEEKQDTNEPSVTLSPP